MGLIGGHSFHNFSIHVVLYDEDASNFLTHQDKRIVKQHITNMSPNWAHANTLVTHFNTA